ncbi:MAG TPA: response regulator transcription factor [Chthoniobacteraceae bacterium]|nr:response regulator transcription factor [Chthoniobacteraceae bacterium]
MTERPPLRALLADDERLARKRMRELLEAHPEITVVGETDGVESTVAALEREPVDVLFLDVQMPPRCGFEVLGELSPPLPRIVFVTAHDRFAVRAFEADAFDYLLKPVHPERLAETVRRLLVAPRLPQKGEEAAPGRLELHDYVALRDKGRLQMVAAGQIAAIEAEAAYSRVILCDRKSMLILRPIQEWERLLPAPPFTRLDRSLLVNLRRVRTLQVLNRSEAHLGLEGVEGPLVLGRSASVRLRRLLAE